MMRNTLLFYCLLFCWIFSGRALLAQSVHGYCPLDKAHPVYFYGDRISYAGTEIKLDKKTFFIDGQLSDETVSRYPFVFNSFNEAAKAFVAGTEAEPMRVYIAPYVYWIDNPDDPQVRVGKEGKEPFGLVVKCPYLHLIGLTDNPENVVLASSRGQTQGAVGNFTMFDFWGDGLLVRNLTMGNYCNVDLKFPLKKELERRKRMSAITQAHVAYCHGDKIVAENVRFISRLNMNPLNGAKRILFYKCYMESTDDALTGTGVYLDCTLKFYGQKPFWQTDMGGAVFLNSDFYICHEEDRQYFCKGVSPLSVVDCRFHVRKPVYAGWTHEPSDWLRCYQYGVTMNGQPYILGADKPYNTVCMEQRPMLCAYRLTDEKGHVIYNTYNLLRGNDDWDPLHVKDSILAVGVRDGKDYTSMPVCLSVTPLVTSAQTGGEPVELTAIVKRHCNYVLQGAQVRWKVQSGYEKYVSLSVERNGKCVVEARNHEDETKHFTITAFTEEGLECAVELTVTPDFVEAPAFVEQPKLQIADGRATVCYSLDLQGREDESLITWYRVADKDGKTKYPVAVSRLGIPETTYRLTKEDVGYYLMVTIAPKHLRCRPGKEYTVTSSTRISRKQIEPVNVLETDFRNFPCTNQPVIYPGGWTIDGYKPFDTAEYDWKVFPDKNYWVYGKGINGAHGMGLLQAQRGARLLYTPLEGTYGDMKITLNVDPSKTAGQGFGSATGQYMDICIKFDTRTLSGYALRIIRTTKYSNAVDFMLMKYENGRTTAITPSISSTCYRTDCTIVVEVRGNKLMAHAETSTPLSASVTDKNLQPSVSLEADILPNLWGGMAIQHTGSCGESTTMLHYLKIEWKDTLYSK